MKKYSKILSLVLVLAMLLPGFAQAADPVVEEIKLERLEGSDRVETAIKVSKEAYEDGKADTVVLAGYNGEADALTGTLLAKEKNAPVLLTYKDKLDSGLVAEINRLGAKNVYILGGDTVVFPAVETALKDAGFKTTRLKGDTRVETAIAIANEVFGSATPAEAFAVEYNSLADALAIGPVAANKKAPILITYKETVPAKTEEAMKAMQVKDLTVVGGENAVSEKGHKALQAITGKTVARVAGSNRDLTSLEIANKYFKNPKAVVVANGYKYADALVGGYFAAKIDAPILLTNTNTMHANVLEKIKDLQLDTFVLGGPSAVSEDVFNKISDAIGVEETPEVPVPEEQAVMSVKALNAKHIAVKFAKVVDTAAARALKNYIITHNSNKYGSDFTNPADKVEQVYIAEGGKTVVFELKDNMLLDNGDRYSVDVKSAVTGNAPYGDEPKIFEDKVAPVIQSGTKLEGDKITIYYDEPVSFIDEDFGVNVDGVVVFDKNETTVNKADMFESKTAYIKEVADPEIIAEVKYSLEIDLSKANLTAEELKSLKAEGSHDVTVYNMRDIVYRNGNRGNKVQIATTKYSVAETVKELKVLSITAKDFNTLEVKFSKAPTTGDVKVVKGNTVFFEGKVNQETNTIHLPYTVLSPRDGLTSLYGENENSVNVMVTVENYQDEDKVVGKKYQETVTLKREAGKPNSTGVNTLSVDFADESKGIISSDPVVTVGLSKGTDTDTMVLVDASKVSVKDVDGINRTVKSVELVQLPIKGQELKVTLEREDGNRQNFKNLLPLTVIVDAGALEVKSDKIDVESPKKDNAWWMPGEFTNKLVNDKFEEKANLPKPAGDDDSRFKYVEAVQSVKVSNDNRNVITVTYTKSMDKSAAMLKNYTLDGKALPTGTKISMDATSKVVTITFEKESVKDTYNARLQISQDVKTSLNEILVGNVAQRETYMTPNQLQITDNSAPVMMEAKSVVAKADQKISREIEVKLSEKVNLNSVDLSNFEFMPTNSTNALTVESILDVTDEDAKETTVRFVLSNDFNVANGGTLKLVKEANLNENGLIVDSANNKMAKNASILVRGYIVDKGTTPGVDQQLKAVETLLRELKDVENIELADVALVEEARTAYDALSVSQKAALGNLVDRLTAAEAKIVDLKAVKVVTDLVEALPAVISEEDVAAVEAAEAAFNSLNADQQALLSAENLTKLQEAVQAAAELEGKVLAVVEEVGSAAGVISYQVTVTGATSEEVTKVTIDTAKVTNKVRPTVVKDGFVRFNSGDGAVTKVVLEVTVEGQVKLVTAEIR